MLRDLSGAIVPLGKSSRKLEANFLDSTVLPTWMTLTGTGSAVITTPEVDCYGLQINTGAAINDAPSLNILPNGFNFGPNVGQFREAIMELESFYCSAGPSGIQTFLGMNGTNCGAILKTLAQQASLVKADTSQVTKNTSFQHDQQRKSNIKIHLRCDGTIAIVEGDVVGWEYKAASTEMSVSGIIKPAIVIKNLTAGAKWARISRIALTLIHN
ncbi:hypothetical protein KZ483_24150 [Paenibacillus sp. sptzw28]|uniref:hypothetical protein n=1 Tax=Paenibacillus sp. sptzw28 TaxID=715179 RepID=UPI001C6DE85B|nr:hypothetical protein [Paenibacillus sp. sptzw28]QYR20814.1 hypothetical protein KZ483_24150 [Paenibacillus sp. sptzw28]